MPEQVSYQVLKLAYPARWWSYTTTVRKLLESYCAHATGDQDFSERVAMTAHELLENGVKYSRDPDANVSCAVELRADRTLVVSILNHASAENIATLRQEYAFVQEGEPLEIYILKMQADVTSSSSQLGLARIRYEGEARLNLTVEGLTVIMEATFEMPERPAQHEPAGYQPLSN